MQKSNSQWIRGKKVSFSFLWIISESSQHNLEGLHFSIGHSKSVLSQMHQQEAPYTSFKWYPGLLTIRLRKKVYLNLKWLQRPVNQNSDKNKAGPNLDDHSIHFLPRPSLPSSTWLSIIQLSMGPTGNKWLLSSWAKMLALHREDGWVTCTQWALKKYALRIPGKVGWHNGFSFEFSSAVPGFKSWFYHFLPVWSWASYLTSRSLICSTLKWV